MTCIGLLKARSRADFLLSDSFKHVYSVLGTDFSSPQCSYLLNYNSRDPVNLDQPGDIVPPASPSSAHGVSPQFVLLVHL